jgi:hypothetical protein
MAGCATLAKEVHSLQLEPRSVYNWYVGDEEYIVYRFLKPNDEFVVYYDGNGLYILGEDTGNTGNSYASIGNMDGYELLAISENYWLFEGKEGKIAITFKCKHDLGMEVDDGEYPFIIYSYEELPEAEQDEFVYWFRREIMKNDKKG